MQVEVHRVQSPIQPSDHTYSTVANQLPDTVIVNRGSVLVPDDGDSFRSPFVPDPLRNSDTELQSGYQICASITDQTAPAAQL